LNGVLLEQLVAAQLVNKFLFFHIRVRFIYHIYKSQPLDPIMSEFTSNYK
jgi:hypothetical protein